MHKEIIILDKKNSLQGCHVDVKLVLKLAIHYSIKTTTEW